MGRKANSTDRLMGTALRLFILAGEPSGDRLAADVVARLRLELELELELLGVGGDELAAQGLSSIYPMSDLAVMGITDVLVNLPRLLWRLEQTARAIEATQPDIVVLVDAQDFSKLLAKRLRRRGYTGTIVLYVAPSVWARHPERAVKIKPLFDAVLAVLPFEPRVMKDLGGPPTWYVGHPAIAEGLTTTEAQDAGPLLLLPGSRASELKRHLPLFREMAPALAAAPGVTGLVIPTLPRLRAWLAEETRSWPVPVTLVDNRADRTGLYAGAMAAVCASGTATLELALARVPMAVVYSLGPLEQKIFDQHGRPHVSLPNIILRRGVLPEVIGKDLTPAQVQPTILSLIGDKKARQGQVDAFGELSELMEQGEPGEERQDPAERILLVYRAQRPAISV
jgi:lipid-A-disaccharide synthase